MKSCILSLLFFIINFSAYSQELKIDSVKVIKANRIVPSTKKYIQYTENKDGTINFNSILTREIQRTFYKGKHVFLIIQKYQTQKGISIDSSFVETINLKPIAYHTDIIIEGYQEKVEFSKNEISNITVFADSTSKSIKPNKDYYNGVIMNDLIGELPLNLNKKFLIKTVNPGMRYFEYNTIITVLGTETLDINSIKRIKCWKLKVSYASNRSATEWYSVDEQLQIKSLFEFDNGNKFIRTMIIP